MLRILFSDKDDWKIKSEGRYDKKKYTFSYAKFNRLWSIKKYDMVIPLYERDIHILNKRFKNSRHKFLVAANEVVDFCNDKFRFNTFLIEKGFGNNIPRILQESSGFPYILKKNLDEWGSNSHIVDSEEKEKLLGPLLSDPAYFKQEYISGVDEHTTHFIFTENKLQYFQTFKFTFQKASFVKGMANPPFKTSVIVPVETEHAEVFEKILQAIHYNGVGCFDYKIQDGVAKIFELNPRVGGSLPLDLINFLEAYKKLCFENAMQKRTVWQKVKTLLYT
ncbi:MAG: hypothetical protein ACTHJT_17630 [Cytophaga sp.]|uniref:hypothetical protein n=1 Tax=Cytophaga sp. TaxID=29535 RepID=UPI003F7D8393